MSILNARGDSFYLEFSNDWFYPAVKEKWDKKIRNLGIAYKDVTKYMSWAIQSITLPSMDMGDTPEQIRKFGKKIAFKNSKLPQEMFDKEITLSFKLTEAHYDWGIMLHQYNEYIKFDQEDQYLKDIILYQLDHNGYAMYSINFSQVIFKNISNYELSKSSNTADYKSFDAVFSYNFINFQFFDGEVKII